MMFRYAFLLSFILIIVPSHGQTAPSSISVAPDLSGTPTVVDINRFDLEKLADDFHAPALSDNLAHALIDFNYMAKAGTQGVMFQASYGTKGRAADGAPDDGEDDCFRLWAAHAARSGLLVGAYHFYHPTQADTAADISAQVDHFLGHIRRVVLDNPDDFRGQPIVLAFDLRNDKRPGIELLKSAVLFARTVHAKTGVWPGIYPENGDRRGINNDKYYAAVGQLAPDERRNLQACWLWASRYNHKGPDVKLYSSDQATPALYYGIWSDWKLWQYNGAENWYTEKDSTELHYDSATHFPIAAAGALMPVDCNYFHNDPTTLNAWWKEHGWTVLPQK